MKRTLLLFVLLSACAPLAPSVSKYKCTLTDRLSEVALGDRSADVEQKVNLSHTNSVDSDGNIVWTYVACVTATVTFNSNDEVIKVAK